MSFQYGLIELIITFPDRGLFVQQYLYVPPQPTQAELMFSLLTKHGFAIFVKELPLDVITLHQMNSSILELYDKHKILDVILFFSLVLKLSAKSL